MLSAAKGLLLLFITLAATGAVALAPPDLFGRRFPPSPARRIVSLAPSTTEMLFALGLDERIAGVTSDCNYPPAAGKKPKVGKFAFVNKEQLLALRPDLIVAPAELRARLGELRSLPVPVVGVAAPDLPAMLAALRRLGELTGRRQTADRVAGDLERRVRAAERDAARLPARRHAFYYLWPDPLMTAGTNSFIGDVLRRAGADSVAGAMPGAGGIGTFSLEQLVARRPDAIVVPRTLRPALDNALRRSPWNSLPAVRAGRVVAIEDDWIARPGPRAVLALEMLQKALAR